MKELLKFAMSRRFLNKANLVFMSIVLALAIGATNIDRIINFISPGYLDPLTISSNNKILADYLSNQEIFEVVEKADIEILFENNQFDIKSDYHIDTYNQTQLMYTLQEFYNYHTGINENQLPIINFTNQNTQSDGNQYNLVLALVSAIFFMMISFVSMSASEIVYEKTTKLLEIILSAVSVRAHFASKLLVGWLAIIIQAFSSGSIIIAAIAIRYFSDQGENLLKCFQKLGLMLPGSTKMDIDLSSLLKTDFLIKLGQILIIVMMGVVVIQLLLISVSSFISNMEEANNLHSPIYISFMVLYYIWLMFNQPAQLESGFGYLASFLPVFSMLFMPSRMMLCDVGVWEVNMVIMFNFIFLLLAIIVGYKIYQKGILYYGSVKFWKKFKVK
ncbi:MAG: ABC transporter permease [Erysipelotrichaceae bacterium]